MKKFLAFEAAYGDGLMVYVNPDLVEAVLPAGDDTKLMLTSGEFLLVGGQPSDVASRLIGDPT